MHDKINASLDFNFIITTSEHHSKISACLHTASRSRVSLCWSGPAPAAEPVCTPRRYVAETEQAAPRQGKDAAPAGGRSETETLGIDYALHCSGWRENNLTIKSTAQHWSLIIRAQLFLNNFFMLTACFVE